MKMSKKDFALRCWKEFRFQIVLLTVALVFNIVNIVMDNGLFPISIITSAIIVVGLGLTALGIKIEKEIVEGQEELRESMFETEMLKQIVRDRLENAMTEYRIWFNDKVVVTMKLPNDQAAYEMLNYYIRECMQNGIYELFNDDGMLNGITVRGYND